MAGYQFTPGGIIPLGQAAAAAGAGDEPSPAVVPLAAPALDASPPKNAPPPNAFDASKPLTGKQIAAMARARLREVERTLASVPALERERDGLRHILESLAPRRAKRLQ